MSVSPINSYEDLCSEFILEQYKRSEKLLGLINLVLEQCDLIEEALHELLDAIDISKAEGPALDFIGALVGVERVPGQTDDVYRVRILQGSGLAGLPAPEVLRNLLKLVLKTSEVGLYPCWPAGLYFVLYEHSEQNLPEKLSDYYTSGVDVGQGTFLCCEEGEPWGLIVLEDNEQPIVVDQRWLDTEYAMVDDEGYLIVDDEDNIMVGIDYLIANESLETT